MNDSLKSFLGILNALVISALAIVFISFYYANAIVGKVMPWIIIFGAFLFLFLCGLCCAFIYDFDDDEVGYGLFSLIGCALCIAGVICTVLVSEYFWIMTGTGMAEIIVFLIIDIATSKVGFMRIASAIAATVVFPIAIFGVTIYFASLTTLGAHAHEGGLYIGYSLTELLDKESDAKEIAFVGCAGKNVEYLEIAPEIDGKPVNIIYKCSFRSYGKLRSVVIPTSIKTVYKNAFKKSRKLENAVYLGSATEWCSISFYNKYSNPTYYAHDLYVKSGLLTTVDLDDGLEKISSYSFYNCEGIKSVYIPETVTEIGAYAFYRCSAIDSITYGGTSEQWRAVSKGECWSTGVPAQTVRCNDGAVSVW